MSFKTGPISEFSKYTENNKNALRKSNIFTFNLFFAVILNSFCLQVVFFTFRIRI
jgi:hypothetical protein